MKTVSKELRINAGSILTAEDAACRKFDEKQSPRSKTMRLATAAALFLGFVALIAAKQVPAADWQSTDDIARVAEEYVRLQVGQSDRRVKLRGGYLDPRLKLPRCDTQLEAYLQRGSQISSRTVVGVRCTGSRPWKVYMPVDIVVTESLLIARKTLPSGHLLTAADLVAEDRETTRLAGGYFSNPATLVGQRLKQQVIGGNVISSAMVAPDVVIKRGQSVTLLLQTESLNISMTGKALTDGAMNQRIKVEVADRTVEGMVRSPETIEILAN